MNQETVCGRRNFIRGSAAMAACAAIGGCAGLKSGAQTRVLPPRMMWAYLAQLGMKMWERRIRYTDLKVDESMWRDLTDGAAKAGVNVFVFDLGEGMVFPSHTELAVRGSWEPERMKAEIDRLAKMGMIAVPKLNFSASHDQWLGKWRKYLSTPEYFNVCRDIIRDVAEVFDKSPLFHLGYDEETFFIQDVNKFEYKRIRSGNAWWNDFLWFVREVEGYGMRAWVWSDGFQLRTEEFVSRMPRSVLQSNWYYGKDFGNDKASERVKMKLKAYETLEKAMFDQMPCGSTFSCRENFRLTVSYCRKLIRDDRLKGFFMAPWYYRTQEDNRAKIMTSLEVMGEAIRAWKDGSV